ncbi:MAG TPA: hypothetical protein VH593_10640 [Ktedonobacteraceae bacterium]|jgi:Flp pilus assembly protein TadB
MAQQELFPEPQENEKQSYGYTPPAQRHKNEPKEEHPSLFTGEIPPYSYQAQDRVTYTNYTNQQKKQRKDRATSAQQARVNNNQRGVPSWARPQRHRGSKIWRILVALVVIALIIKLVPLLILSILALLGTAFIIIVGVCIIVGLVLILVLLGMLILLGIPLLRLVNRLR